MLFVQYVSLAGEAPTLGMMVVFAGAVTIITLLLCNYAERIAGPLGLLDLPNARKRHALPTPLMGGIVLFLAVIPVALGWTFLIAPVNWRQPMLLWVIATAVMTAIGLADDRVPLSPTLRLVLSAAVISATSASHELFNIRFLEFENPSFAFGFGNLPFSIAFTTCCMLGFANAVNMADGKNGLILGLTVIWTVLLGIRSPPIMWPYYLMLLGALLVMLHFNLIGRLFLGDGGSYGLATAIGLLSLMIYNMPGAHANRLISAEELILLFFVPVADLFRVMCTRVAKGRSPFAPDRTHLHHVLLDRFDWPISLLIYYAIALVPVSLIWALDTIPENYG